jgi:DNA replication and repair protein RecF
VKLTSLTLSQFRCWTYREFSFSTGINYVEGPNASGKTTLLEAIHYLSTGRSFRTSRDTTCVNWEADVFEIRGVFGVPAGDSVELSLSYGDRDSSGRSRKKVAKRNEDFVEKISELRREFITLIFTPDEMSVLKEGPENRRRFLDDLLAVLDPDHLEALRTYETNRKHRNSLLKNSSPDPTLLRQYERRLVETGREIIRAREEVLPALGGRFSSYAEELLGETDSLELEYDPDVGGGDLEETLENSRDRDLERGFTTRGPHRDDWMVYREGRSVDRFASQGELRTLLLALKVSVNFLIIKRLSKEPILLLDDLESELDSTRRSRFLSLLHDGPSQVIVTGTGGLESSLSGESSDRILSLEAR